MRRRRLVAAVTVGVIVAGVVAGVLMAGGMGSGHDAKRAVQGSKQPEQMPAAQSKSPSKEAAAVKRFVKLGYPLWCGGHKGKYVALTFDDGPGPYTTRYALKIFRQFHTRVTWFLVGRLLSSYPGRAAQGARVRPAW